MIRIALVMFAMIAIGVWILPALARVFFRCDFWDESIFLFVSGYGVGAAGAGIVIRIIRSIENESRRS